MPSLIGPGHHLFYGSLHRRRLWLGHLSRAFAPFANPGWEEARRRLDASFARTLLRLSREPHLGIQYPLPLHKVIDDTPIESFLTTLSDELDAYEHNLFDLIQKFSSTPGWLEELEEASLLWGRELAQELQLAMAKQDAPPEACPAPGSRSLRGLSVVFTNVLNGGDFSWRPILFRRRTDTEIQYELRCCPHRKPVASAESANLACRLDSLVYRGFAQSFFSDVSFQRRTLPSYCVDELLLR